MDTWKDSTGKMNPVGLLILKLYLKSLRENPEDPIFQRKKVYNFWKL